MNKELGDLRKKNLEQLSAELMSARESQFGLRIKHKTGQLNETSELRKIRKKIAMIKTHKAIKFEEIETKLILQVHDELILDTPKKEIDSVIAILTDSMMGAANLDVPLEIDVGIGDNWDQAH